MEKQEDLGQAIQDVSVVPATEASLRLQVTDLLLGRPRGTAGGPPHLEQWEVLREIGAALEAYGSYIYPPEHR